MPSPLRVAIVTDAYPPGIGGVENHSVNLARELARLGHEVTVVTHKEVNSECRMSNVECRSAGPDATVRLVRLEGGVMVFRDHDIAVDPTMLAGFGRLLDRQGFDVVHGQGEASMLVYGALWLARRRGIPTVLTRHSMLRNKPRAAWPLVMGLTRLLLPVADGVISVSEDCAEETGWFGGPKRVIPNGVDTSRFAPSAEERAAERADRGYRPETTVIGYTGRLHRQKGVLVLADAIAEVRREWPQAQLVFAGPGPLRPELARRAAVPGSGISLLDPLDEDGVVRFLRGLDVFAFASQGESFGIAVLEAMACALPVVALERWGVRRLVRDGETGYLCRDAAGLASRMVELCRDPGLRARLGAVGQAASVADYGWSSVATQTAEFYQELVPRRAKR